MAAAQALADANARRAEQAEAQNEAAAHQFAQVWPLLSKSCAPGGLQWAKRTA